MLKKLITIIGLGVVPLVLSGLVLLVPNLVAVLALLFLAQGNAGPIVQLLLFGLIIFPLLIFAPSPSVLVLPL
jgi:hypothetical protein